MSASRRSRDCVTPLNEGPLQVVGSHRPVPRSLSLEEERDGAKAWRCAHCHREVRFPDELDDFECAIPLFSDSEGKE